MNLSPLLLALAPQSATGPQQVPQPSNIYFDNERYLTSGGGLYDLAGGATLPGNTTGDVIAEFDFASTTTDPQTGLFLYVPFDFIWTVEDASGTQVTSFTAGDWFGHEDEEDAVVADPVVISFDALTGQGTAQIRIPIGAGHANGQRFPLAPEGASRIEVAIGIEGVLGVTAQGSAENALYLGAIDAPAVYPDVWMDLTSPIAGPGHVMIATLHSTERVSTTRTYVVRNPFPQAIEFFEPTLSGSQATITFPPDVVGVHFQVRAIGPGSFFLSVEDGRGVPIVDSIPGLCESGHPVDESAALAASGFFFPGVTIHKDAATLENSHTGGAGGVDEEPLETGLYLKCVHPDIPDRGSNFRKCSECSENPSMPDCPSQAYNFRPAECESAWFGACFSNGNTDVTGPSYDRQGEPEEETNGCPKNTEGGGFSLLWGLITISGSSGTETQTSKFCCIYEKRPNGDVEKNTQDCNS